MSKRQQENSVVVVRSVHVDIFLKKKYLKRS